MDIETLRHYLTLTQEKTISKAAKSLYMTQPNLSRQMSDLERELGKTLFIRESKQIRLTREGEYLKRQAQRIVSLADSTVATLGGFDETLHDTIRIVSNTHDITRLMSDTMGAMAFQYPLVRFHLSHAPGTDIPDLLRTDSASLGVVLGSAKQIPERLCSLRLPIEGCWGVLARNDSRLAYLDGIRPENLLDVPLAYPQDAYASSWFRGWLGHALDTIKVPCVTDTIDEAGPLVRQGVAYALTVRIPQVNNDQDEALCFRELVPAVHAHVELLWNPQGEGREAIEAFLSILRADL